MFNAIIELSDFTKRKLKPKVKMKRKRILKSSMLILSWNLLLKIIEIKTDKNKKIIKTSRLISLGIWNGNLKYLLLLNGMDNKTI